jgi:hypothetical protein
MTFQQDTNETAVLFRKYPNIEGGEVIALFPEIPGDMNLDTCSSFVHVGQHSAAHVHGCINGTRPAKPAEYADLKRELESAPYGYRLKIYKRLQRSFLERRRFELTPDYLKPLLEA